LPPDSVVFNPIRAIPLPATGTGDVTVLTEPVPTGYDGIILAHFHTVVLPAGDQFMEGSGDIVWRLAAAGRFLRDLGNMTTIRGSQHAYDPIAGGSFVRTDNRIVYTVNVQNVTGTLPATGAMIIVGLHGWFMPRGGGKTGSGEI
jgi:hypothetical protein